MEISLFMSDISDDFAAFNADGLSSAGWLDSKSSPNTRDNMLDSPLILISMNGENAQARALKHLFIRQEDFGGLVFEGVGGRAFQVDEAAFAFLTDLQAGLSMSEVVGKAVATVGRVKVENFLALLKQYQLLSDEILEGARENLRD